MGEEIANLGRELAAIGPLLSGARIETPVAMLDQWTDRVLFGRFPGQRLHEGYDARAHALAHHAALRRAGCDVDVLPDLTALEPRRLLVAPRAHHLSDADALRLADWVRAGGHLLLGARSGWKEPEGAFWPDRAPGPRLRPLLGAAVRDAYALGSPQAITGALAGGGELVGEGLEIDAHDVEVLATWAGDEGWLAGRPAIVTRAVGRGRITYCGAIPDAALADTLTAHVLARAGIQTWRPPAGIEVGHRHGVAGRCCILVNTTTTPVTVDRGAGWRQADGTTGVLTLPAWGAALLIKPV